MTVAATPRKAGPYAGNGVTTVFPFAFKVFTKDDVQVIYTAADGVAATLVLNSDYSMLLNSDQDSNPGGTITYPKVTGPLPLPQPLPAGDTLTAIGDLPYAQPTDVTNTGRFLPQVIENALDRATIQIQQLAEIASRTLQAAVGTAVSLIFPAPSSGKFLRWRTDLLGLENAEAGTDSMVLQGLLADGTDPLKGSSMVGFLQAGVGAGPRNLQQKDREIVSATDFYANGSSGPLVDPTGLLDSVGGIQRAIDSLPAAGGIVEFPPGTFKFSTSLVIRSGVILRGRGSQSTSLSYTGAAQAVVQSTPGTRIFGVGVRGMRIVDAGTGTIGLDLNSVSSSEFDDAVVSGFTTGVSLTGPNGFCVYNRFFNINAQSCVTGWLIGAAGSNSNTFLACRANNCSSIGFDITDSNQNQISHCQLELCTTGVRITATSISLSDHNTLAFNRFEGCTTNYDITSANVRGTFCIGNHKVTGAVIDNGTRSVLMDPFGNDSPGMLVQSAATAAASGAFRFVRLAQGGASLPAMVVRDDASGGGTPTTLQVETERPAGKFFSGQRGGVEYSYISATGALMVSGNTPTAAAGQMAFGAEVSATVGAAGGGAPPPATPVGYIVVNIGGIDYKIPYYLS